MRLAVTVAATAGGTQIVPAVTTANANIQNLSAQDVFLQWTQELDALTVDNGWKLGPGESITFQRTRAIYPAIKGIVASSTAEVRVSYY